METIDWVACPECGSDNVLFNAAAFDGGGWRGLLFCPDCGNEAEEIVTLEESE